jgi:hypothetical protein
MEERKRESRGEKENLSRDGTSSEVGFYRRKGIFKHRRNETRHSEELEERK